MWAGGQVDFVAPLRVGEEVTRQLADLPREKIAGASWRDYGAIILVADLASAAPLVDRLAPEHLEIMARDADALSAVVNPAANEGGALGDTDRDVTPVATVNCAA